MCKHQKARRLVDSILGHFRQSNLGHIVFYRGILNYYIHCPSLPTLPQRVLELDNRKRSEENRHNDRMKVHTLKEAQKIEKPSEGKGFFRTPKIERPYKLLGLN